MSAQHRGIYQPRPIICQSGTQILHIPRSEFPFSSTLIIEPNGIVTSLPYLASTHALTRQ